MPLAREHRERIAHALQWSRLNGWTHDAYPNTWRSRDGRHFIRYDTTEAQLIVDRVTHNPLRYRVALVPVDSPDVALRVLAALGHLPLSLGGLDTAPELGTQSVEPLTEVQCGQWPEALAPSPAADLFDGPASFTEAGQAFADLVNGRVTPDEAAGVLSWLARAGLIVSAAYHDESTDGLPGEAALMADVASIIDGTER